MTDSIWQDVHFDYARATSASLTLQKAAAAVRESLDRRASLEAIATTHWYGPDCDQFAHDYPLCQQSGAATLQELQYWAGKIEDAIGAAQAAQRRRERARIGFFQERAQFAAARLEQAAADGSSPTVIHELRDQADEYRQQLVAAEQASVEQQQLEHAQIGSVTASIPPLRQGGRS